ncbi:ABC transporter permease [Clostridium sp. JN-9]|uniref:ABC transporter permease n=1 Tax=Clostridium sp. JN-9 TaxID=2507159 RepID=UPI000FFE0B22|nr:ABC transporter permease [Clostridium sp. JN-9]QAT40402.1 ABC transporter permease [Clostridium sp. JN-9]
MKIKAKIKNFFYGFIIVNILWYIIAKLVMLPVIQNPLKVYANIITNFYSAMFIHIAYSLFRVFSGVCIALIIGMSIGLIMARYKAIEKVLSPIVYFTYPVPKIALLPVVMLLLGLGELSKITMIFLIVVFQIIISTRDAVKSIPNETYNCLISLGASRFQIFNNIIMPNIASEILTTIRISLGTAISVLFFTETYGTEYGMGYYIMDAWMRVNYLDMYSGIVILSILGMLLFAAVDTAESLICKWKH